MSEFRRRIMMAGGGALPYDAEVEYIESTGTQGIDTEITPNSNMAFQLGFVNKVTTGDLICGYYHGSDNNDFRLFNYSRGAYFDAFNGVRINSNDKIPNYVLFNIELGNYYIKDIYSNSVIVSGNAYTGNGTDTIKLCGPKDTTGGSSGFIYSQNRIYSFKAFENGVLISDCIPVRIGFSGYLYDNIQKRIMQNSGTGDFLCGNDIIRKTYDSRVEYLESSGTQFIDIGAITNSTNTLYFSAEFTKPLNGDSSIFGAFVDGASGYQVVYTNRWYIYGGTLNGFSFSTNIKMDFSFTSSVNQTAQIPCFVFARNNNNGNYYPFDGMRIYSLRVVTSGGILLHDFTPVRIGNTGYLYDSVNNSLHGNAGTGDFILGNDMNT